MTTRPLPQSILRVAEQLAKDVDRQIQPHNCVFGPTAKGSSFHFRVCRAGVHLKKRDRERVIAWAGPRGVGGVRLRVSVVRPLLGNDPIVARLVQAAGGSFGDLSRPECWAETRSIGDAGYQIILQALVAAAQQWLRRN